MSSTPLDVIVESHQIASDLKSRGKPIWSGRLDVSAIFHNDALSIIEKAHQIGAMIKAQPWFDEDDYDLQEIAEMLCDMTENDGDEDYFDDWWATFYDWCDLVGRIWVET